MSAKIELWVEETGERLDTYLAEQLPDLSRSRIQKLIADHQVLLNGEICTTKKAQVQDGDRIQLTIPDAEQLDVQPENIPLEILYEDDHLLILNKPAGMVVHPSPGHTSGTLVNALLWHCRTESGASTLSGIGGVQRPGIVHRLDKDTSGAIAIAKTDQAHHQLQQQFQAKTARRSYVAVVYGAPAAESGTIDLPIGRHRVDRKKMAIVPEAKGGRKAVTHWQIKERLGNHTLINFELETGRTHQIRVHTAQMGHPIIGDPVYGSGRSVGVNLEGQALHAWRLRLQHPVSGEWVEAIAPIPPYFSTLVEVLRRRFAGK
ncbi:RluA family pseudouridine synthase [Kovacikia minuta CCNUW1]|uniref:RluA family pseudouridine synthase n=1 Tax=Kovacikia minuta TaxID=2931930 RepID=UPI001CCDEB74|nr:RluA family pseudouridine synthase [Kovacikia minuta]UBF27408.1 RluA family pseudouridine synthase [Kovacikia minuta CCNUW1]